MDTGRIEALGLAPIAEELAAIEGAVGGAERGHPARPVEPGRALGELRERHGVVGEVVVPVAHDVPVVRREPGLQVDDEVRARLGLGVGQAGQAQHPRDVRPVRLADRRVRLLAVVRLVGQAEAGLVEVDDVALGVLGVVVHPEPRGTRPARALQAAEHAHEVVARGGVLDRGELLGDRRQAEGLDAPGVHERGVERPDLRRRRGGRPVARGRALGELGDDRAHLLLGAVVQLARGAVGRAVRGDLERVEPPPVDVPEQVVLRARGRVEGRGVDAAAQPRGVGRHGPRLSERARGPRRRPPTADRRTVRRP